MCDRLIFFRYMTKHYAKEEGLLATMMPKPFADKTGNGAHFNMSLYDLDERRQSLRARPEGRSARPRPHRDSAIISSAASCGTAARCARPSRRRSTATSGSVRQGAMSYFSWAPVFNSYGSNNRTNSVRVPMGGGRCESRNADGAVNPYLAATLALAAGLEGIREKIDPGDPNEDNLYTISDAERRARGIDFLPQTCRRRWRPSPPIR